jgi:uncharacterized protein YyaL (SSP411 family)
MLLPLLFASSGHAEDDAQFLNVVRRYADTMIDEVRDTYGPQKSGLMLSAFDRTTMTPLTTRPAAPGGARRGDRAGSPWQPLTGANPHIDQNLLRALYTLSAITGDPRYGQAADQELEWFFKNTQSPVTGLMAWGEHLSWDVMDDKVISGGVDLEHEFARPWMLWDRCYELAPEASKRFALGLWEHQIADHTTGGFDRHAPYDRHGPHDGKDFARHAGFYIQTWAYAYKHTTDDVFLKAIEVLLARFERKGLNADGTRAATIGPLDTYTASTLVPDPLASRLKSFAAREDDLILDAVNTEQAGVITGPQFKPTWEAGYSSGVTASMAMFYLARYEQVGRQEYRDLVIAIADAYRDARPAEDVDIWPMSFGHVISAQLAAYRFTGESIYLDEARRFGRMAIDLFWQDRPLPRASLKTEHYETLSGADTLALALLDLYAAIHDLKVAVPSNTIDR